MAIPTQLSILTSMASIQDALRIANSIRDISRVSVSVDQESTHHTDTMAAFAVELDIPQFYSPKSMASKLLKSGPPDVLSEGLFGIYLKWANELKIQSETIVRKACLKLVQSPRSGDKLALDALFREVFELHHTTYLKTLSSWLEQMTALARSQNARVSDSAVVSQSPSKSHPKILAKRSRRRFKAEYLPLFEFAFEKDRFPSREDKKHLSRISGMSYRQVNVWFQNRRCRQPSRGKSHRTVLTPKTFEEMKARLGPSARAALSESTPLTKKLNPDFADPPMTGAPVLMRSSLRVPPVRGIIVLDDDVASSVASTRDTSLEALEVVTTPGSSTRAVSLGATDDGFASDEHDDSSDEDVSTTSLPKRSAIAKPRPSPPQKPDPLDPLRTSVHAFPTPYAPSQLTSDPFIIEHHPWLRDPCTKSKKSIEPMPEAMEEILGGFNHMGIALL